MNLTDTAAYYVVFDTNTLFQDYTKKADFTTFSFNATYDHVVDMINQLDIYNQVVLTIPTVVWNEMEKQIIEKHDELLAQYKSTITKKRFPEYTISENTVGDYAKYIRTRVSTYKDGLSNSLNTAIELPIATSSRFESIVDRAFKKRPPFEGKDKKSDKGFKDALLWESILEFAYAHPNSHIIYYSKDNAFGEVLLDEFAGLKIESTLSICKNETEVKEQLEVWAEEIDKYSYQPIEEFNEHEELIDWLNSGDFLVQVIDRDFGIVEKGRLITSTVAHLLNIDNIEQVSENELQEEYTVDVALDISYTLKDGGNTSETISVCVHVQSIDNAVFSIEDAYRTDECEE